MAESGAVDRSHPSAVHSGSKSLVLLDRIYFITPSVSHQVAVQELSPQVNVISFV